MKRIFRRSMLTNKEDRKVAFNMKPVRGPWGGSSLFVSQMSNLLERRGFQVHYNLKHDLDVIILVDPRTDNKYKRFGLIEIAEYKKRHPHVKVLHRINECDQRKNTTFMDKTLADANTVADYTVFISEWLRDYHIQRWFDPTKRHCAIYNGADPAIFYPSKNNSKSGPTEVFRIVTHHWSNNRLKGFDVYEQVDEMIAGGELNDVEFRVIGRWPEDTQWKAARTFPACANHRLAGLLRDCHAYLTASLWEPCGMHHVEGAQCGLPLMYHEDGGGIVEAGRKYGIGFRDNVKSVILEMRDRYDEFRQRLFTNMPSGDRMCLKYADIIQMLMCGS